MAAARLATGEPLAIDVRTPVEREQKSVAGSVSIPLNHLAERVQELPTDRPLLVYCGGGYRSALATDNLQKMGYCNILSLDGGWRAIEASGLPLETN